MTARLVERVDLHRFLVPLLLRVRPRPADLDATILAVRQLRPVAGVLVGLLIATAACRPSVSTTAECSLRSRTTESGLSVTDEECGTGDAAQRGTTVRVSYIGRLQDGTVFEETTDPISLPLGAARVIPGLEEAIVGMEEGGERTAVIPPDLAYGEDGLPPIIPGGATLIYEISLVAVTER